MNNSKGKYFKCNKENIKKCNTLYLKLSKLNGLKVNILLEKNNLFIKKYGSMFNFFLYDCINHFMINVSGYIFLFYLIFIFKNLFEIIRKTISGFPFYF